MQAPVPEISELPQTGFAEYSSTQFAR